MLLQRLIVGGRIHSAATAAAPTPWTASASNGTPARRSSSGTTFLFDKYADSPENLVELMRRIVRRGGRGRKQDNVPKEVVKIFCERYQQLDQAGKQDLLLSMARDFTPSTESVAAAANRYAASVSCARGDEATGIGASPHEQKRRNAETGRERERGQHIKAYERLREELSPAYEALLKNVVAESDDGVRFVVDLRQDLLEIINNGTGTADPLLLALDGSIRSLLQAWFSVGFLELRRITFDGSSGALLEKIARYEAVHPTRSLAELKARLGEGRRCFAFFHPCLPDEPLVFVHVALLPEVASSMADIVHVGGTGEGEHECKEIEARSAVFYSISATQKGLQGVQLGNFLIKRVVAQLRAELPQLETFATLSPIPSFRSWLLKKAKHRAALGVGRSELSGELLLTADEAAAILSDAEAKQPPLNTVAAAEASADESGTIALATKEEESRRETEALAVLLSHPAGGGGGTSNSGVPWGAAAQSALTRLAARYLVRETVRGKIPDPVGNFHVSNGARVERLNWKADVSSRGIKNSFGVMVNYVYDPLEIESNNRQYLSRGDVPASSDARKLAWSLMTRVPQVVPEGKLLRDEDESSRDGSKRGVAGGDSGQIAGRKPSQQSYRIKSRRALKHNAGPRWAAKTMKNSVKRVCIAYTTSRTCMLLLAMATLSSCLFYILATYLQDRSWVRHTETAYGILFLVDYCLSAVAAPVPLTYALSRGGLIDLVSCLPAFSSFQTWMASLAFVRYLRVGKAIRVMRNHNLLSKVFSDDDVTIKATLLIVKVVGVVMMTSAIIFGVERGFDDDDGTGAFNFPGWKWHDAFYFTIVTLSTVGYGDILPISVVSRLLIIVVIIFALTYIPLEVGKLVDAINARPKNRKGFSRSLVGNQLHVVLALSGGAGAAAGGGENEFNHDMLERCVSEFFDDDQKESNVSVWVVIMAPSPPSEEISALCRQPKYGSRVVYFKGSVTNPRDMSAVCAEYADCIFLFPSSSAEDGDPRAAQETTHLAAKAVRRYIDRTPTDKDLMDRVRFLSQTGNPRRTVVTVDALHSKHQLLGFGIDHVICLDELKLSMLAVSTLCPAFLPFVANCVRSCENSMRSSSAAKAKPKSDRSKDGSGRGEGGVAGDWLDDYAVGTNFEIYSVPLEVISGDSTLWTMSFSRAARIMYDDSDGTVLLLAVVEHREPSSPSSAVSHRGRPKLPFGSTAPPAVFRAGSSSASASFAAPHHRRKKKSLGEEAYAHVEIFPEDDYRFTIDCHLLVLAETQTAAEDLIFNFQKKENDAGGHQSAPFTAALAPASDSAVRAPCATDIAPGGDRLGLFFASNASASAIFADASAAAATTTATTEDTAMAPAAAAGRTDVASTAATATAPSSTTSCPPSRPPNVLVSGSTGVAGGSAAGEGGGEGAGAGSGDGRVAGSFGQRKKPPSRALLSKESLSALALGSFSPATSLAPSTGSRMRSPGSVFRDELDEETKEELNSLQKQAFQEDEIDWTLALDALKRAKEQLDELDLDQESSQNPAKFFDKVNGVSSSVADALRMHTASLPEGLRGHIVLVGGSASLQYYVLALRRQRPLKPIVVVTEDSVLIDLSNDDSIYYCGIVLGGTDETGPAVTSTHSTDQQTGCGEDVRYWPLFAAGRVWTTSIMDVFAVRTYFNAHVLAFFETLLQIDTRHLHGADGTDCHQVQQQQQQQQQQRSNPASVLPKDPDTRHGDSGGAASGENGKNTDKAPSGGGGRRRYSHGDTASNKGRSQFAHLHVSSSFAGLTYGDLTRHLIAHGAVPLGLFRPSGTKTSTLAYAHINPPPEEPLEPWPAGTTRRRVSSASGDNEGEHEEKGDWGEPSALFEQGAGGGGSGNKGGAGGGRDGGGGEGRGKAGAGGIAAGDDVFVLRSRGCLLSGTPPHLYSSTPYDIFPFELNLPLPGTSLSGAPAKNPALQPAATQALTGALGRRHAATGSSKSTRMWHSGHHLSPVDPGRRGRPVAALTPSPAKDVRSAMTRGGFTAAVTLLWFFKSVAAQYDSCTTGVAANIGNGQCDEALNVPSCGYDGGDCCSCTCLSSDEHSCADNVFNCLYPGCDDAPTLIEEATCVEEWLGDGGCDSSQSGASCGYDGGDCCECTCVDGPVYSCGITGFDCQDPACFDPAVVAEFPNCTADWIQIGDGFCNSDTNVASCGYDGGDCCPCSCLGSACAYSDFDCLDPDTDGEFYECEAAPPAPLPCSAEVQREWVVDDPSQARALRAAVNCSGGSFEVEWRGTVVVDEPIYVADGTTVTISGVAGSMASIDGNSSTRLFTVVNAALHLDGLNVSYGSSTSGGAIAAAGSTLTFNRTNFLGNTAISDGGAVFVTDASVVSCAHGTTFVHNRAGIDGGAMFASGGSVVSCGGRWLGNAAVGRGGALKAEDESSVSWSEESAFELNTAGSVGGALHVLNSSRVSWDAPTGFYYNSAGVYGGALYVGVEGIVSWQAETVFSSNSAGESGGSVGVFTGSNVSWSGEGSTVFDGNQAEQFGGALYVTFSSHISWRGDSNTVFDGNQAGRTGGALAVVEDSQASCTVDTTTTFSGNSAVDAGAIFVSSSSLHVHGVSLFEDNAAISDPQNINTTGYGGAVYLLSAIASVDGSVTLTGNTAGNNGGALFVTVSTVLWNAHTTTAFFNNASSGGVLAVFRSSVSWNGLVTMAYNNAADLGGAMYVWDESSVSFAGQTNFSSNVAAFSGGAFLVSSDSIATWSGDATFAENESGTPGEGLAGAGGAVSVQANSSVAWSGGTTQFIGNVADGFGSALWLSAARASWSGPTTEFINNSATIWGTLHVSSATEVSWTGETLFEGNRAATGAALFIFDGSYVGWTGETRFFSNEADIDGGAVASLESDPESNPRNSSIYVGATTTFSNNTSGANGGGLSLLGACSLDVDPGVEVSYVGNTAEVAGGAVFVSGAGTGPAFSSATFVSNSAQVGGAVAVFGSGNSKSVSEAEPPDPTTFHRCRFEGNRATTGGAIDSAAGHDFVVDSTFEDNVAGTGGALRLAGTATIDGCSFVENFSDDGGGAVVSNIGTISSMSDISFSGNGFNCPAGMYLDYNTSGDPYEAVCDGCPIACDGCVFTEPLLAPICSDVIAHSTSSGGKTTLEELSIERGYWRATNSSETILACYNADACLGGETGASDYCLDGYEGPYCAVCSEGYLAQFGFVCGKCSNSAAGVVLAVVLAVVAFFAVVAVVSYATTGEGNGKGRGLVERVARYVPLQSVKIVIVAWQILTQFTSLASVTYPQFYQTFLDGLNVFNFDLSWILSAGCIVDIDFHDRLLMSTISPIVAVLFLGCTYCAAVRIHKGATETLQNVRHKHVSLVLLLTFVVYSSVSSVLFSTFACEVLDDRKDYLRSDYRIECDSPRHRGFKVYAGFMIVLYTVGIPAFYAGLLWKDRDVLRQEKKDRGSASRVSSTSDLWKPYKPSVFYYEVIECARRIMLAGVVVFIYPNSAAQIAITLMVAFAFVLVSEGLAPYASKWDHWISRTGHVVVIVSMYMALLLKVDVSGEQSSSQKVFEAVLIAVHAVMVLMILVETVVMGLALKAEQREDPLPRLRTSGKRLSREKEGEEEGQQWEVYNPFARHVQETKKATP
eukprot:g6749.t1